MTETNDDDHQRKAERERGDQRVIFILIIARAQQANEDEEHRADLGETSSGAPLATAPILRIRP
jgi:hypothetical protein